MVQNGLLELANVLGHATNRIDQFRIGLGMGPGQFGFGNANRLGGELSLVDPGGIIEHGGDAVGLHIATNSLDDLLGRQRLAENLEGAPSPSLADDVPLGTELRAQLGHRRADVLPTAANTADVQDVQVCGIHGWHFSRTNATKAMFTLDA